MPLLVRCDWCKKEEVCTREKRPKPYALPLPRGWFMGSDERVFCSSTCCSQPVRDELQHAPAFTEDIDIVITRKPDELFPEPVCLPAPVVKIRVDYPTVLPKITLACRVPATAPDLVGCFRENHYWFPTDLSLEIPATKHMDLICRALVAQGRLLPEGRGEEDFAREWPLYTRVERYNEEELARTSASILYALSAAPEAVSTQQIASALYRREWVALVAQALSLLAQENKVQQTGIKEELWNSVMIPFPLWQLVDP